MEAWDFVSLCVQVSMGLLTEYIAEVCNHCYLHLNSCLKSVRQNTYAVNFDSLHVQLLTVCNVQIAISASYLQQARNPQSACERAKELGST